MSSPQATRPWRLRPAEEGDGSALVELWNRIDPASPTTEAEHRHNVALLRDDGHVYECRVAVDRSTDRLVGSAEYFHDPDAFDGGRYWVEVNVDLDRRRRGLGTILYGSVEAELAERGARQLRTNTEAAVPDGAAFARRHGFEPLRDRWRSVLEVARCDVSGLPARRRRLAEGGIELTTLGDEGADDPSVVRRLYELETEISRDEPRADPMTPLTPSVWESWNLGQPGQTTADFWIARHGGSFVGLTYGRPAPGEPGLFLQSFTGVRRDARGQGIATALKLALIDRARAEGYVRIRTSNDSSNAAMWGINERLGFVRTQTWTLWGRDLPGTASP